MKVIIFEIDDRLDGSVTGRTKDRLTNKERVAIAMHVLNHMDFEER